MAVPVKDRREQMLRCLDALLAQDHPDYEILVLDNESTDGTPEAIRERAATAPVPIRVETIAGPVGYVRNQAGHLARGEFLAFTDSDCLPEPGWLRAASAALLADERLGVIQGRTLPEVPPQGGWAATIQVEQFSGHFEGCNLAFRRAAFAASDGFDETVGHYWEDTVVGYALRRLGWTAGFAPHAVVRHDVTYPGFWWHVKRMQKHQNLAPVLARYPEMRDDLLIGRLFLAQRDVRFVALVVGILMARRRPALAVTLALPYATFVVGTAPTPLASLRNPKAFAQAVIYDSSRLVGLLRGGLRNGQIVL